MTDQQALLNQITAFETHYHYDAGFLKDMVQHAPGSYDHFQHFQTMARHRELLSTEVFWIAKHGVKMTGMPSFGTRMLFVVFKLSAPLTPKKCKSEHWPVN